MPMHPAAPHDLPGFVDAFALSAQSIVDLGITCSDEDFDKPTGCPGWTVKDVMSHLASTEAMLLGRPDPQTDVPDYDHLRNDRARLIEQGVELRRSRPGKDVAQELHRVVSARLGRLRDADLDGEMIVESPMGPLPLGELIRRRVRDMWVHEQDIRTALGRPGNLDAPGAALFCEFAMDNLPRIVVEEVGVKPGKVVMIELTGPIIARTGVRVEQDEDGAPSGHLMFSGGVDETGPIPAIGKTTSIQLSTEAFTRRAAGRRSVQDLHYSVIGDEQVAADVLEHLVVTP
ncbi:MAG: maleylpyruvate isomerase N-terminal domain-containing protein [Micrococcales bacterium]|nr:maleylpyruvate isomerase N-terminal domain-containing protein [Micrococcales bacterium]